MRSLSDSLEENVILFPFFTAFLFCALVVASEKRQDLSRHCYTVPFHMQGSNANSIESTDRRIDGKVLS